MTASWTVIYRDLLLPLGPSNPSQGACDTLHDAIIYSGHSKAIGKFLPNLFGLFLASRPNLYGKRKVEFHVGIPSMVRPGRIELPTSRLSAECSNQLSYERVIVRGRNHTELLRYDPCDTLSWDDIVYSRHILRTYHTPTPGGCDTSSIESSPSDVLPIVCFLFPGLKSTTAVSAFCPEE